jgi:hypothetical protein
VTELAFGSICVVAVGGFFVFFIVLIVLAGRRDKQRNADLATLAAQREWSFRPDGTGLERRFDGDPFGHGSRQTARNAVEGRYEGRSFVAFDYSYVTSNGEDSTTHHFSVVALHLGLPPHVYVPRLQVRPQGSIGRFFSNLFGTDHRIGQPAFDDAFHVLTDSPELAHDVLHPGLTAMLMAQPGGALRFQGDSLLLFTTGSHSPAAIDAILAWGNAILGQVPPPVWAKFRGEH